MLDVSPPEWVSLVAEAGFEAVGIRIGAASPTEEPWPITEGSPMLKETLSRLDATGVVVQDVELIRLTPESNPAEFKPLFDVGAVLGARFFNVMVDDPDLDRGHDIFAALSELAHACGLRACMEGISYMAVRNLEAARRILAGTKGGLIVDPLHMSRARDTPAELSKIPPETLAYLQLCDGPATVPTGLPRPDRLPRGQAADVSDAQLESRAARLLPGDGEMPVAEIVAAVPADLPVSVEAPNLAQADELGRLEFLKRARRLARDVLAEGARLRAAG